MASLNKQAPDANQGLTAVKTHIGINAHLLANVAGYRQAGIHHYIAQVLRHLPRDPQTHYVVYTRLRGPLADELAQRPDMTLVGTAWPTERRLVRILWEQVVWPWQSRAHALRHSMAFVLPWLLGKGTAVVTIYDLSFMQYPERFPRLQRWYLQSQTRRACQRARRIIVISESGRQDVGRWFGVPAERVDVVLPGVGEAFRPLPPDSVVAFRTAKGLPDRFVLHVGTLQPRKNIPLLIAAFAQLTDQTLKLVLVGGKGWLFDEIFAQVTAVGLTERVIFAGYVPEEELPLWYNAATVLVFPSLYEGFGLPIVEAMACGLPVIAAHTSSIPEAAGEAALTFDPQNERELVERLTAVLGSPALAQELRHKGLQQAQTFSWTQAGQQTAQTYQRALHSTSPTL